MGETIREICILSIVMGTVCSIAPESPVKTVMSILCSVILMLVVLEPLAQLDMASYAQSLAKYKEMEKRLSIDGEDMSERLNRMVIEEEYTAYIRDKAEEQGITLADVKLEMSWNTGGYWMPVGVQLYSAAEDENMPGLGSILESQLGIPREKQKCIIVQ